MIFQIHVRTLLTVTAIATLVNAYKLNCSPGSASSETPSETKEGFNITETWTWLPGYVNTSEPENETMPWDKVLLVRGGAHPNDEQGTNWCIHVGVPFEKVNFSRFQLTNKCCKEHVQSVLVEVNNNLRYKCTDETEFYNCLKTVNTTMSRSIGDHYFNKVPPTCYKIEEEDYCYGTLCASVIMKISTDTLPVF